jgi:NB-ARC domain
MDAEFQTTVTGGSVGAVVNGDGNTVTINPGTAEQRTVPFLAPPLRRSELVGRGAVIEQFKKLLLADEPDRATALTYLVGVGKSALALQLAYDGDVLGKFPDGVLWASLGPEPHISALLGSWAEGLGMSAKEIARRHTIDNRQQAIKARIGMSRMLLVVDDAWHVDAANAFLLGGPRCVHVLTTRLPGVASDFAQDGVVKIEPLSEDDGVTLLAKMAPAAVESEPEEARKLVREVGGLPLALVIIGRYLAHECRTGRPRRVRAALESMSDAAERLRLEAPSELLESSSALPEGTRLSLLASIATSEATLDEEARRALRGLSVWRPKPYTFDESAAEAVTGSEPDVLDALEDTGLVEAVGPTSYALQPAIADYARAQLSDEEAKEYHRRARDYQNERLRAYEERSRKDPPYERQYRYEKSEWEELEEAFLFHASQADTESADLAFAQAYLDGFFWWGCYVESPYCERRLRQWKEHPPSAKSSEWIDAFSTFHDSYPTGYEKHGRGDWQAVEHSLQRIRELASVDGDLDSLEGTQRRRVRALIDLFLAHARRYLDPVAKDADAYYAEARNLCQENEDDQWIVPWIEYELGDLALERGDVTKARENARTALELANESDPEERDHEVIANCFRLIADAEHAISPREAVENYTLAVFYAYKFQASPQPPDLYTREFYREITDRTAARIEESWRDGREREALDWCRYLHDFWREYWELAEVPSLAHAFEHALKADDRDELKQVLFPREPDEKSFGNEGWRERVSSLIEKMAAKVSDLEKSATT